MTEIKTGQIAYFSQQDGEGFLLTQPDRKNYKFLTTDLRGIGTPEVGALVEFELDENDLVRAVFPSVSNGSARNRSPSQKGMASSVADATEKEESWMAKFWPRILLAGAVVWVVNSDAGKDFISSFLAGLSAGTDISTYDCNKVAKLVKGEELQNMFGGRFKILSTTDLELVSQSSEQIVCNGTIALSNAREQVVELSVWKDGNSIMYKVQPR